MPFLLTHLFGHLPFELVESVQNSEPNNATQNEDLSPRKLAIFFFLQSLHGSTEPTSLTYVSPVRQQRAEEATTIQTEILLH